MRLVVLYNLRYKSASKKIEKVTAILVLRSWMSYYCNYGIRSRLQEITRIIDFTI
jgi:hypothetical protein